MSEQNIQLIVIDVDGTMTDGGIYYDVQGNELKKFNTRDAAGLFAARAAGIETMVLTGRESEAVKRRMTELKVDYLVQGIKDKYSYISAFMEENQLSKESICYIGDDLNDLMPMRLAGYVACPADACEEIKEIAHYVSPQNGGDGVVRDVITHLLKTAGVWSEAITKAYGLSGV